MLTQTGGSPAIINYSDIQFLSVNDVTTNQGGNDTFDVTGTSAATTLDGGPGSDTLNLDAGTQKNGTPVLNAPLSFQAGPGRDSLNVYGPASGNDSIMLANEPAQNGRDVAALLGDCLQLQYSVPITATPLLNVTLAIGGADTAVDVLGTLFNTTIEPGSGTNIVNLGGYGPGAADQSVAVLNASSSPIGSVTQALAAAIGSSVSLGAQGNAAIGVPNDETLAHFEQPIAIAGGSGQTHLTIDDSADRNLLFPALTATNISGVGAPAHPRSRSRVSARSRSIWVPAAASSPSQARSAALTRSPSTRAAVRHRSSSSLRRHRSC